MASQPYGRLVYLASPLTHEDMSVRAERTDAVCKTCVWFLNHHQDLFFFSPIAHAEQISRHGDLPYVWEFWAAIDECMLSRCDEMWILCIPGWKPSVGVNAERKIAERYGLPLRFVLPQPDQSYTVTDEEPGA